jgi:flagellar operon protein
VDLLEIAGRGAGKNLSPAAEGTSFRDMFSAELADSNGITFSKHAGQRLHSRGIELSDEQMTKIAEALDKARAKGSRETLILTEEAALVVSVENRTVITAFDRENLREGVVTSIDSAVIL